jgi:hypothetical protein
MLQYYTLMRMKNKMKELEKNLAQHRANERIIRYKLEAY